MDQILDAKGEGKKTKATKKCMGIGKGKKTAKKPLVKGAKVAKLQPMKQAGKPAGKKKTRGLNVERSINQVLARTGYPKESGLPGSKAFKYKTEKEIPKAKKLALAWLAKN